MPKERQTCTECSMRRQKCDRNVPCGRCVKRGEGDKCTREWPEEGYDPKKHRTYPRSEKDEKHDAEVEQSVASTSIASPRKRTASHPDLQSASWNAHDSPFSDTLSKTPVSGSLSQPARKSILSFVTWGTTPLENFKLPGLEVHNEAPNPPIDPAMEWNFSNGFGSLTNAQTTFLQMLLPSQPQIDDLVEYHLTNLIWCHASIHAPTFRAELKEFASGPNGLQLRELDMRWAALLFAVMAASIACAKEPRATSWGFRKDEKARLTRQWFKACVACLNLADYMWKHHIYSLQAIATLTLCGHLMGFSNTQTTLLSAAIKIAQSLGLQRLGPDEDSSNEPANRERLIRVETSRRIWFQLCIQDWFSIPFSDMYSIQKHHFSTIPPLNYDDETMNLLSDDAPSVITYLRPLQALGRIMSDCHDAVIRSSTELAKYETVLEYEAKINAWRDGLPSCVHRHGPMNVSWPVYSPWIRRSLEICHAHKIMMIHRNFLGRSFTDPAFAGTRQSCMAAAKNILQETRIMLESDAPLFWIDHAFMVAAGITLCLDIFHRKPTDIECDYHRKLVEKSISILNTYEDSMIAARGVRLLSSLLTEQARAVATQSLDNYNRTKRMRESETEKQMRTTHPIPFGHASEPTWSRNKRPRQKFDLPRFVETLGHKHGDLFNRPQNTQSQGGVKMSGSQGQKPQQMPSVLLDGALAPGSASPLHIGSMAPSQSRSPAQSKPQPQTNQLTASQPPYQAPRTGNSNIDYGEDDQQQIQQGPTYTPGNLQEEPSYFDSNHTNSNGNSTASTTAAEQNQYQPIDLGYETFEQFFPPQTGISNNFLFEDLLNFDF